MKYKIFYDDGTTYSDQDGNVEDAPGLGIIVIVMESVEHGRFQQARYDYYVWKAEEDAWVGCDLNGKWDYDQQPGWKKTLFGRTISNARFDSIMRIAENDNYFPKRTGWAIKEIHGGTT